MTSAEQDSAQAFRPGAPPPTEPCETSGRSTRRLAAESCAEPDLDECGSAPCDRESLRLHARARVFDRNACVRRSCVIAAIIRLQARRLRANGGD
jgi:hypothetical protein